MAHPCDRSAQPFATRNWPEVAGARPLHAAPYAIIRVIPYSSNNFYPYLIGGNYTKQRLRGSSSKSTALPFVFLLGKLFII